MVCGLVFDFRCVWVVVLCCLCCFLVVLFIVFVGFDLVFLV